jgi:hypothetical protein
VTKEGVFQKAFDKALERINTKTGWGKNELKDMMLTCLAEAIAESND